MKNFIWLLAVLLIGCGGGGGGSASAISPVVPDDGIDEFELTSACQVVIPGYIWGRFDPNIDAIYLFELTGGCVSNANADVKLYNVNDCGVRSHFQHPAYEFCFSGETAGLASVNNVWLTIEEL